MKKKILMVLSIMLIVATCAAIACTFAACDKKSDYEYIKDKGTLVCGITLYEPMNYADADGEMTGFDTEFAEAVCAKLGLKAKFQVIKWSSKENELNSKYIDCIWNGFTVTPERAANLSFSQSYLNNTQCVVVKKTNLSNYTSIESCKNKQAAVEAGSAGETAAQEVLEANTLSAGAQINALTEVASGNVDIAVVDVVLANSMVGKGNYANLAIATDIQLESEEYAIGFRKGSDMVEKVNAVINELLADGTLETLAVKYGVDGQLIK